MAFNKLIRFVNSATGIEKILRFLQSVCQILAVYTLNSRNATTYGFLRKEFALGRRYLRFFKFLECFSQAYTSLIEADGILGVLAVGKFSCLGAYMFLESITILDAIGIYPTPWAATCMLEANRFWFYSLSLSIILGTLQLLSAPPPVPEKNDKRHEDQKITTTRKNWNTERKLIADVLNLAIPGHVLRWIPSSPAVVGFASLGSTMISGWEVWESC